MKRQMLFIPLLLSIGMLPWAAQAGDTPEPRSISVSGSAMRLVAPDQVSFRLSVEGRGPKAGDALEQAGARVGDVLRALRSLVAADQIRALNTDLRKVVQGTDRSWVHDRGEPMEMLATRIIQVERLPIGQLGEVMDAVAAEPLARIDSVTPVISNARSIEDELQIEAAEDARRRAQKLAKALGVGLGLPLQVEVNNFQRPQPRMMVAMEASMMKASSAGAGYEQAGQQEINAELRIQFELIPLAP